MKQQLCSMTDDPRLASDPGPTHRSYEVWADDHGWCSACLRRDLRVVLFGERDGLYHGLCAGCLVRLDDGMHEAPSEGDS